MKINKLNFTNFQSYSNCSLDLENISVAGIIGNYKNNKLKSNGVGKSTIVDSILYALYGKSRTGDDSDLVKENEDTMIVQINFEINSNNIHIIRMKEKSKNKLFLYINDKDVSEGLRETQEKITRLLGMDFNLFVATVFFQQDKQDSFTAANPSVRKEYLKNILNLEIYDKCYEIVKKELKELNEDIEKREAKLEYANDMIKDIDKKNLDKEYNEKSDKKISLSSNIKSIEEKIKKYSKYSEEENKLNAIINEKIDSIEEIKIENDELYTSLSEYEDEFSKLNLKNDSKRLKEENDILLKKIENNEIKIKEKNEVFYEKKSKASNIKSKAESIKENSSCPICERKIDEKFKEEFLNKLRKEYKDLKIIIEELSNEIKKMEQKSRDLGLKMDNNNEGIENNKENDEKKIKLNEKIKMLKENISNNDKSIDNINKKIKELNLKRKDLKSKLKNIDKNLEKNLSELRIEKDEIVERLSELTSQINEYNSRKKDVDKLKYELKILYDDANVYNMLKNIFSKNGIIAEIIKISIDEIQDEANKILNDISDDNKKIIFETLKENKSGNVKDTLDIFIENNNNLRKYESFSGGEKTIINFSIRMALSRILSQRERAWFDIIILDEVFASLDKYHREQMTNVINYLKSIFKQIFIISHTELQDSFPNLIRIEKNGNTNTSYIKNIL